MMPYFIDIDGNFVEQFQTTGFDSRIWELYLYSYFIEERFRFDRNHNRPDFMIKKYNKPIAVEAVIVGRKDSIPKYVILDPDYYTKIAQTKKERDEMAIRYGSPLYTKLQKEYWKLEHVRDEPFILAIADFHEDLCMTWSFTHIVNYLYGYDYDWHYNTEW